MKEVVYFALDATRVGQFVKIGYTAHLRERIASLRAQTASGQVPIVLALEEGGETREQELHERFKGQRMFGEWFTYTGELMAYIQTLENPVAFFLERPWLRLEAGRNWPVRDQADRPERLTPTPAAFEGIQF